MEKEVRVEARPPPAGVSFSQKVLCRIKLILFPVKKRREKCHVGPRRRPPPTRAPHSHTAAANGPVAAAQTSSSTLVPVASAAATARFALLSRAAAVASRPRPPSSRVTSPVGRSRGSVRLGKRRLHTAVFVCRANSTGADESEPSAMGPTDATTRVVLWFRNDLRLSDNYAVHRAAAIAAKTPKCDVLPVFCFDPRVFAESEWGTPKTGGHRARFQLECVEDLRKNLRAVGSDLLVAVGEPERIIAEHLLDGPGCANVVITQVTSERTTIPPSPPIHSLEHVMRNIHEGARRDRGCKVPAAALADCQTIIVCAS